MSIEIYENREEEIRAIASVTSLFLTGSFILREFGIQPFLQTGYNFLTGSNVPEFFLIALGIIGVYEIKCRHGKVTYRWDNFSIQSVDRIIRIND